ncbi:MAG: translation elongation factor-like protein [Methanobacteriota archaeon]|nr:MAG: translation elongation factor-like protein [Euryarchaeota archaeon]
MSEKEEEKELVGRVSHYFSKISVAAIELTDGSIEVGDTILIEGGTTRLEQVVESMQIEHNPVNRAEKGQSVGVKVKDRVRPNDKVYRIIKR